MSIKRIVFFLIICFIVVVFFLNSKRDGIITSDELARIIDVDVSSREGGSSSRLFREVVRDDGEYVLYKLEIPSFYRLAINRENAQFLIPCYLFLYKDTKKRPGVLIVPGNGPGIESTAGLVNDYENGNALFLAKAGFNVLTCDNVGFNKYSIPVFMERVLVRDALLGDNHKVKLGSAKIDVDPKRLPGLLNKKTLIGVLVQDQFEALQVLKRIPTVDKVGVGGASMGAMIAMYLAAFDEEVSAVVGVGFFNRLASLSSNDHWGWYDFSADLPEGKMFTVASLIAPTNALYVNGKKDVSQSIKESVSLFESVKEVYASMNAEQNVSLIFHEGGHVWKNEVALEFFNKVLK